ncbi:hypothetical protein BD311DRAFT_780673 [Dichomitus squalens]|uniref:ER membrane protein complex subunit 1 n=1 Tax=Dichomitus squalens TaxID=114155 RepID=A0A4Q9MCP0_9APHY|nr:hypothetical protein BD311DRAFT_780673 [Dichomitus squalens]
MRHLSLFLLCLAACTHALHSYEVGVTDWHKPLAGVPLVQSHSTAPVFHRRRYEDGQTSSVVLTATQSNVLAAIHSANGSIAWRHIFDDDDHIIGFKRDTDIVVALSGPGGANFRVFDSNSGHLLLERRLHDLAAGRLQEPESLGTSVGFGAEEKEKDIYVLTNGHTLRRLDRHTGEVRWGWTAPDQTSSVLYSKIFVTPSTVYLLGLSKSFASYTLHVTSLSPDGGVVVYSGNVPSSIKTGFSQVFVLSDVSAPDTVPRVVWFEDSKIKSLELAPELTAKPATVKGAAYKTIEDVGLSEYGQFVAIAENGSGRVIKLTPEGLKVIWEYSDSATSPTRTGSIYSGGLDVDGHPYIARVFWAHSLKTMSAHVFASHLAEGKGLVTGYTFPFKTGEHGIIRHVAVEAANPEHYRVLARLAVTTTTGAVQMWQKDQLQWTREEGLADIRVAELVELPERKIALHLDSEHETFGARVARQLLDAQDFPQYAVNFVRRFVTGSYTSVSTPVVAPTNASEPLSRDAFGFRKVIVAATPYGKIYGIDSANGDVLWSRVFGLGWAAQVGGQIIPAKLFVTRTVNDGESPQVVLVTQRKASNGLVDTVLFHVDALTGEDARRQSPSNDLLQGEDAVSGPLVEAFLLPTDAGRAVVLLDEFLQVHLYPNSDEVKAAFAAVAPSLRIPLRSGPPGQRRLTGHQVPSEVEFTGLHIAYPTWSLPFPTGEDIFAVFARPTDPVASLGKVLGNRTTLYKYLNPNLVGVVTGPPSTAPLSEKATCGVYLLDGAKGTIIYHSILPSVGGRCEVKATLVENWLVYHYYDPEVVVNQAKGYRVVSVELYEGRGVDDKRKSSDMSSLSNATTDVSVYEQAYVFPRGIRTITPTSTSYGISVKDIIVANENGQIQSFPRRFLDPRRPKHKPTTEEAEEWLIQYDPVIPDDPKRVLSHHYQVAKTQKIVTSPALLESTSLVFAHGLDLFFTRIAPSNTFDVLSESFNKPQLVVTIAGLAFAIVVVKPIVARKKLRERWYD